MYYHNYQGYRPQAVRTQNTPQPQMRLAQAYVPFQPFRNLYSAQDALAYGTVFMDLNQGYETAGGRKR